MHLTEFELVLHLVVAVAAVLLVAYLGRLLARALRQPSVIGEIVAGLAIGPVIIALAGRQGLTTVLPPAVSGGLKVVGQVGLALYLVGVVHQLHVNRADVSARSIGLPVAGALLPPLMFGGLLGCWILWYGGELRGTASPAALVLMVALSLSVTAVPVLARILTDQGLTDTSPGRLAMTVAVIIDGLCWLLLGLVIGLAGGRSGSAAVSLALMVAGLVVALATRRLLGRWTPARFPRGAAVGLAAVTLATSIALQWWGLTSIIGAVLVGLAVPSGSAATSQGWSTVVRPLRRAGRALVPVFFVATGVEVFVRPSTGMPWTVLVVAIVLAVAGKLGGGYLGARLGGQSPRVAVTVGVLLNTRGLTELVVLQAGYTAGILTAELFLAMVVMALFTTATTGPLLKLVHSGIEQPAQPDVFAAEPIKTRN